MSITQTYNSAVSTTFSLASKRVNSITCQGGGGTGAPGNGSSAGGGGGGGGGCAITSSPDVSEATELSVVIDAVAGSGLRSTVSWGASSLVANGGVNGSSTRAGGTATANTGGTEITRTGGNGGAASATSGGGGGGSAGATAGGNGGAGGSSVGGTAGSAGSGGGAAGGVGGAATTNTGIAGSSPGAGGGGGAINGPGAAGGSPLISIDYDWIAAFVSATISADGTRMRVAWELPEGEEWNDVGEFILEGYEGLTFETQQGGANGIAGYDSLTAYGRVAVAVLQISTPVVYGDPIVAGLTGDATLHDEVGHVAAECFSEAIAYADNLDGGGGASASSCASR